MAEAAPLLYFATAAATATSTLVQADEAKQAASRADALAKSQQAAGQQLLLDQKANDAAMQADIAKSDTRDAQSAAQLAKKRSQQGRAGTILTTPYGADSVPLGATSTGAKTLLGT